MEPYFLLFQFRRRHITGCRKKLCHFRLLSVPNKIRFPRIWVYPIIHNFSFHLSKWVLMKTLSYQILVITFYFLFMKDSDVAAIDGKGGACNFHFYLLLTVIQMDYMFLLHRCAHKHTHTHIHINTVYSNWFSTHKVCPSNRFSECLRRGVNHWTAT